MAAKTLSLDQFRKKKQRLEQEAKNQPFVGVLIWLFCPQCKSLEYTHVHAPHGRSHKCGSQVIEREVKLDIRAEMTIAYHNLELIKALLDKPKKGLLGNLAARALAKALESLKLSEDIYLQRLNEAANHQAKPYEGEFDQLKDRLPLKHKNKLGLWISDFRHQPQQRFDPV